MRKQDTRQAYTKEEGAKNNMDTVETSGQKEGRAVDRVGNGKWAIIILKPLEQSEKKAKKDSSGKRGEARGNPTCF